VHHALAVTETDLPKPRKVSKEEDSHAEVAQLLKAADAAADATPTVLIDAVAGQ
jgi:hypothetical protein